MQEIQPNRRDNVITAAEAGRKPPTTALSISPIVGEAFEATVQGGDTGMIVVSVLEDDSLLATLASVTPFRTESDPKAAAERAWSTIETGSPQQAKEATDKLVLAFKSLIVKARTQYAPDDPAGAKASSTTSTYLALLSNLILEKVATNSEYSQMYDSLVNLVNLIDPRLADAVKHFRNENHAIQASKFEILFDSMTKLAEQAEQIRRTPSDDPTRAGGPLLLGVLIFKLIQANVENLPGSSPLLRTITQCFARRLENELEQVRLVKASENPLPIINLLIETKGGAFKFFRSIATKVQGVSAFSEGPASKKGGTHEVRTSAPGHNTNSSLAWTDVETLLSVGCYLPGSTFFEELAPLLQQKELPFDVRVAVLSALKWSLHEAAPAANDDLVVDSELEVRTEFILQSTLGMISESQAAASHTRLLQRVLEPLRQPLLEYLARADCFAFTELSPHARTVILNRVVEPTVTEAPSTPLITAASTMVLHHARTSNMDVMCTPLALLVVDQERIRSTDIRFRTSLIEMATNRALKEPESLIAPVATEILSRIGKDAFEYIIQFSMTPKGAEHRQSALALVAKLYSVARERGEPVDNKLVVGVLQNNLLPRFARVTKTREDLVHSAKRKLHEQSLLTDQIAKLQGDLDRLTEDAMRIERSREYAEVASKINEFAAKIRAHEKRVAALEQSGDPLGASRAKNAISGFKCVQADLFKSPIAELGNRLFAECFSTLHGVKKRIPDEINSQELRKVDVDNELFGDSEKLVDARGAVIELLSCITDLLRASDLSRDEALAVYKKIKPLEVYQSLAQFVLAYRFIADQELRAKAEFDLTVFLRQSLQPTILGDDIAQVLAECAQQAESGNFIPSKFAEKYSPLLAFIWEHGLKRELNRPDGFKPTRDTDTGMSIERSAWTAHCTSNAVTLLATLFARTQPRDRGDLGRVLRGVIRRWSMHYVPGERLEISTEVVLQAATRYLTHVDRHTEESEDDRRKMNSGFYQLASQLQRHAKILTSHQISEFVLPFMRALIEKTPVTLMGSVPSEVPGEPPVPVRLVAIYEQTEQVLRDQIRPEPVKADRIPKEAPLGLTYSFVPGQGIPALPDRRGLLRLGDRSREEDIG